MTVTAIPSAALRAGLDSRRGVEKYRERFRFETLSGFMYVSAKEI